MKPSQEFVVGKHGIGWVSSDFLPRVGDEEFKEKPQPTFQKLGRSMTDAQIERELKPGLCDLGDVIAFMDNAPAECKDGYANLFYFSAFVVRVYWGGGAWYVGTWDRGDVAWYAVDRVFSPATVASGTGTLGPKPLESLDLEKAIEIVKKAGYKVIQEK